MKNPGLRYGLAIVLLAGAAVAAQPDRPVVTMTIAAAGEKPHEVEVKTGGSAVQSKTKPAFRIGVLKVFDKP